MPLACFCPLTLAGTTTDPDSGETLYNWNGYHCVQSGPQSTIKMYDTVSFTDANITGVNEIAPCSLSQIGCPQAFTATKAGASRGRLVQVYERGVPNPRSPFGAPDEPARECCLLGEYTADFLLSCPPIQRVRLIVAADEKLSPHVYRSAYAVHPSSPRSPFFTPHFSQSAGWVTVENQPHATYITIKELGTFCLVTRSLSRAQMAVEEKEGRPPTDEEDATERKEAAPPRREK